MMGFRKFINKGKVNKALISLTLVLDDMDYVAPLKFWLEDVVQFDMNEVVSLATLVYVSMFLVTFDSSSPLRFKGIKELKIHQWI